MYVLHVERSSVVAGALQRCRIHRDPFRRKLRVEYCRSYQLDYQVYTFVRKVQNPAKYLLDRLVRENLLPQRKAPRYDPCFTTPQLETEPPHGGTSSSRLEKESKIKPKTNKDKTPTVCDKMPTLCSLFYLYPIFSGNACTPRLRERIASWSSAGLYLLLRGFSADPNPNRAHRRRYQEQFGILAHTAHRRSFPLSQIPSASCAASRTALNAGFRSTLGHSASIRSH